MNYHQMAIKAYDVKEMMSNFTINEALAILEMVKAHLEDLKLHKKNPGHES